ncbi:hypothetical protein AGDE_16307 [Angomonas deanei]|uniref:Uncharacterized protein n=1 Tax=Angomonas deanei TaxID=59799 RepID=A0A7G2CSB7_9TRYP|nr:hypothetical protein AGDE_16307 [Angomonas deanei]CAD2221901.1 hypothetical protein, conserved [Angomonas deanei]|eukprot:EPY17338.1 hypothetical protein AGDE_16307 [Angomonas deanei]
MSGGFQVQGAWSVEARQEPESGIKVTSGGNTSKSLNPQAAPFIAPTGGAGMGHGGYYNPPNMMNGNGMNHNAARVMQLYGAMPGMDGPGGDVYGQGHNGINNQFRAPSRVLPRDQVDILERVCANRYRTKMLPPPLRFNDHLHMMIRNEMTARENSEAEYDMVNNQFLMESVVNEFLENERDYCRQDRISDFEVIHTRWYTLIYHLQCKDEVIAGCGLRRQCPQLSETQSRVGITTEFSKLPLSDKEKVLKEWSKDCTEWWEDNFATSGGSMKRRGRRGGNLSSHNRGRRSHPDTPNSLSEKHADVWDNKMHQGQQVMDAPGVTGHGHNTRTNNPFTYQLMHTPFEEDEEDDLMDAVGILRELDL